MRTGHGLALSTLSVLTLLVFGHVCGNDFINMDDPHYVIENEPVTRGLSVNGVRWALATHHMGYWIPVTWLSLQLDATLYWPRLFASSYDAGTRAAWGFHLTNLLFHGANVILVYGLAWRWLGSRGQAFFVAALFAVHPLRVESVAWITERKDVVSVFFTLLALGCYQRYQERRRWWSYAGVGFFFVLGLLAKPMVVTLPALLLLLDYWPHGRVGREPVWKLIVEKVPLFVLSAGSTLVTIHTQTEAGAVAGRIPLQVRLANALVSYEGYVAQTFWPVDLAVFYPHPEETLPAWHIVRAAALLAMISAGAVMLRQRVPAVLVGWLWFVVAVLPVSGIVAQAGDQGMADRFTYLPLLGLFVALTSLTCYLFDRWRVPSILRPVLAALVLVALSGATWMQVKLWRNCQTLYEHALQVTENNTYVHGLLGVYLVQQGAKERAERELARALEILPNNSAEVHLYYAVLLLQKEQGAAALPHLERVVRLRPDWASGHFHYGRALVHLSKSDASWADEARRQLATAVQLDRSYLEQAQILLRELERK